MEMLVPVKPPVHAYVPPVQPVAESVMLFPRQMVEFVGGVIVGVAGLEETVSVVATLGLGHKPVHEAWA